MPSYATYLQLDSLLALQQAGDEHDEMLFLIIHQSYELWFKEILHETDHLQRLLEGGELARAGHTIKRVLTILKMLVAKVDILETMTPLEFTGFRQRLESGSGFQSAQFREIEFALGHKSPHALEQFPPQSNERSRLERRYHARALWDSFLAYLTLAGYPLPDPLRDRDVTRPVEPSPALQQILTRIYRQDPPIAEFCERLVDLDEGMQEWRYRHVKMVERTIGIKPGTGGTSGAEYLRTTLLQPVFPDLWAVRAEF